MHGKSEVVQGTLTEQRLLFIPWRWYVFGFRLLVLEPSGDYCLPKTKQDVRLLIYTSVTKNLFNRHDSYPFCCHGILEGYKQGSTHYSQMFLPKCSIINIYYVLPKGILISYHLAGRSESCYQMFCWRISIISLLTVTCLSRRYWKYKGLIGSERRDLVERRMRAVLKTTSWMPGGNETMSTMMNLIES